MLKEEMTRTIDNLERGDIAISRRDIHLCYVSRSKISGRFMKRLDDVSGFISTRVMPKLYDAYDRPSLEKVDIFRELKKQCFELHMNNNNLSVIDWGVYTHNNFMFTFVAQIEYKPTNDYRTYSIIYYVAPTIEAAKITLLPL